VYKFIEEEIEKDASIDAKYNAGDSFGSERRNCMGPVHLHRQQELCVRMRTD